MVNRKIIIEKGTFAIESISLRIEADWDPRISGSEVRDLVAGIWRDLTLPPDPDGDNDACGNFVPGQVVFIAGKLPPVALTLLASFLYDGGALLVAVQNRQEENDYTVVHSLSDWFAKIGDGVSDQYRATS